MKKTLLFLLLLSHFLQVASSQTLTDVARSKELTWYGVDFTQARILGFKTSDLPKSSFDDLGFTTLSDLDIDMIKGAYGKKSLIVETSITLLRNQSINFDSIFIDKTYSISINQMNKVISEYKIQGDGYGVLLLVESIEKMHDNLFAWVIYIDKQSGKIINSRRYLSGGYGKSGNIFSKSGIKFIIKLSGKDLKRYK